MEAGARAADRLDAAARRAGVADHAVARARASGLDAVGVGPAAEGQDACGAALAVDSIAGRARDALDAVAGALAGRQDADAGRCAAGGRDAGLACARARGAETVA